MAVSEVLELRQEVSQHDIDELGHVNNEAYIHWFLKSAYFHGTVAGWPVTDMVKNGAGWVVREHNIKYLSQVRKGDPLKLRTWVETADKIMSERHYELVNAETGKVLCEGKTMWVWVNYKTGRPARIPQELIDDFRNWKYIDEYASAWDKYVKTGIIEIGGKVLLDRSAWADK